jgi:hypothetical protein
MQAIAKVNGIRMVPVLAIADFSTGLSLNAVGRRFYREHWDGLGCIEDRAGSSIPAAMDRCRE